MTEEQKKQLEAIVEEHRETIPAISLETNGFVETYTYAETDLWMATTQTKNGLVAIFYAPDSFAMNDGPEGFLVLEVSLNTEATAKLAYNIIRYHYDHFNMSIEILHYAGWGENAKFFWTLEDASKYAKSKYQQLFEDGGNSDKGDPVSQKPPATSKSKMDVDSVISYTKELLALL